MTSFELKQIIKQEFRNPIVIEGLPGIGNVGKIAIDFIVESIKAKKFLEITSSTFPHSVFINEDNLVDLPAINMYYKKIRSQEFIFIAGDVQPLDERSCHEFCNMVLDKLEKAQVKEIITLGGIGLPKIPKQPKVYLTANTNDMLTRYKTKEMEKEIFGVVGPIIGVSGLLVGLAKKRSIPAAAILAQTFGHPSYMGVKPARELIKILSQKFNFNINLTALDKEISELDLATKASLLNLPGIQPKSLQPDKVSYIG